MQSHYLNYYLMWVIVTWTTGNKIYREILNVIYFIQKYVFENVICKMSAILFGSRWVTAITLACPPSLCPLPKHFLLALRQPSHKLVTVTAQNFLEIIKSDFLVMSYFDDILLGTRKDLKIKQLHRAISWTWNKLTQNWTQLRVQWSYNLLFI